MYQPIIDRLQAKVRTVYISSLIRVKCISKTLKINMPLFTDNMIVWKIQSNYKLLCIAKILTERISEFGKDARFQAYIEKPIVFLYPENNRSGGRNQFTIASENTLRRKC